MAGYILRRVLEVVPTVFLVLTLVFLALRVMPGDPAIAALGEFATPDAIEMFRAKLGLNEPLWVQYFTFVRDVHKKFGDVARCLTKIRGTRTHDPNVIKQTQMLIHLQTEVRDVRSGR